MECDHHNKMLPFQGAMVFRVLLRFSLSLTFDRGGLENVCELIDSPQKISSNAFSSDELITVRSLPLCSTNQQKLFFSSFLNVLTLAVPILLFKVKNKRKKP